NQDAAGNLKPLVDILDEINTVTKNMPVAERTKRMAEAFGLLGITSANVLSGSADSVRALRDGMNNLDGTASRTAKNMDAGLGGAVRIALSAIEGTALAIGDALAPSMISLINTIDKTATAITAFVKENATMIVDVAKGVAIFSGVGVALIGLGSALGVVSFAMGGLLTASTVVIAPLAAIVTTAIAIASSFVSAVAGVFAYSAASVAAAAASGLAWAAANAPLIALLALLGALGVAAIQLVGGFSGLASSLREGVATAASNVAIVFGDVKDAATTAMGGIYDAIVGGDLAGAIAIALKGLEVMAKRIFDGLKSEIGGFQAFLANTADAFAVAAKNPYTLLPESMQLPAHKEANRQLRARQDQRNNEVLQPLEIKAKFNSGMAELQGMSNKARDTRIFRQQADDVIASMASATDLQSMRQLAEEFHLLAATGRLARQQVEKYGEAVDTASDKIASKEASTPAPNTDAQTRDRMAIIDQQSQDFVAKVGAITSASELQQLQSEFDAMIKSGAFAPDQQQNMQTALDLAGVQFNPQTKNQAEVAGTFSSVGLGGMGFGSSLGERQLKALETIASNTSDLHGQLVAE
ncbi:phage tail tape measure protein, partial [bacterium]|nr:phage tail tape measure protein [bacterium]